MPLHCKLHDRGLLSGPEHVARDLALVRSRESALQFGRYLPTASLGAFDAEPVAIRADYCRARGIAVVRRPTGGGALYLDPGQLTWSLFLPQAVVEGRTLAAVHDSHAAAVIAALASFGIEAASKAPNDIEVQGRKLAGLFLDRSGGGVLLQGTLILAMDTETLLKVLRAPMEKLTAEGVQSARERFVTLDECRGRPIAIGVLMEALGAALRERFGLAAEADAECAGSSDEAMFSIPDCAEYAFLKGPGGVLHAWARRDDDGRIAALRVAGTVQATPSDLFERFERALIGVPAADAVARAEQFLADLDCELLAWTPLALAGVLARVLARGSHRAVLGLAREEANSLMLHGDASPVEVLERASVMLVPYCAKPPDCSWRHLDGCPECGKCEVGDAYRLARERGMKVVTITRFEHLQETLREMREQGVSGYVGMCCQSFYLKRQAAFDEAGIPAVLMDISGANCYELQEEDLAYAGKFAAQAFLNKTVVEKVMQFVPKRDSEE